MKMLWKWFKKRHHYYNRLDQRCSCLALTISLRENPLNPFNLGNNNSSKSSTLGMSRFWTWIEKLILFNFANENIVGPSMIELGGEQDDLFAGCGPGRFQSLNQFKVDSFLKYFTKVSSRFFEQSRCFVVEFLCVSRPMMRILSWDSVAIFVFYNRVYSVFSALSKYHRFSEIQNFQAQISVIFEIVMPIFMTLSPIRIRQFSCSNSQDAVEFPLMTISDFK